MWCENLCQTIEFVEWISRIILTWYWLTEYYWQLNLYLNGHVIRVMWLMSRETDHFIPFSFILRLWRYSSLIPTWRHFNKRQCRQILSHWALLVQLTWCGMVFNRHSNVFPASTALRKKALHALQLTTRKLNPFAITVSKYVFCKSYLKRRNWLWNFFESHLDALDGPER